jgi:hypothetical protein
VSIFALFRDRAMTGSIEHSLQINALSFDPPFCIGK